MERFILIAAADFVLFIKIIIGLVFVFAALFKKLKDAIEAAKPAPKSPDAAAMATPKLKPQDALAKEIQDFLKQATQPPRPASSSAQPAAKKSGKRPVAKPRPREQEAEPTRRIGESIAEHVERAMSTRDVTDHSQHLADDLARLDREREERRKRVSERKIGKLQDTTKSAEPAEPANVSQTAAANAGTLGGLLSSADDVRNAIILQEILSRPTQRW